MAMMVIVSVMMIVAMVVRVMVVVSAGGDRPILLPRRGQMKIFARTGLLQGIVDDRAHGLKTPPAAWAAAEAAIDGARRPRRFLTTDRSLDARI